MTAYRCIAMPMSKSLSVVTEHFTLGTEILQIVDSNETRTEDAYLSYQVRCVHIFADIPDATVLLPHNASQRSKISVTSHGDE